MRRLTWWLVAIIVTSCGTTVGTTPQGVTSPGAGAPSASVVPPSRSAASPSSPSPTAQATLGALPGRTAAPSPRVTALGALRGELVFASRMVESAPGVADVELWVIPVDGRPAQLVVRTARWGDPVFVRQQLSPDGKRFAFSVPTAAGAKIWIADLFSGTASPLVTDAAFRFDTQPVWNPVGDTLAFARSDDAFVNAAVWIIGADGRGLRKIADGSQTTPTYLYPWTSDGRMVAFARGVGYSFVDITTGATAELADTVSGSASWRLATPRYIAQAWEPVTNIGLFIAGDTPGGQRRTIMRFDTPATRPRWSPMRDEFLFLRSKTSNEGLPAVEIAIANADGTGARAVPVKGRVSGAEWSSDGESIIYLHEELIASTQTVAVFPSTLRAVRRDGSGERDLFVSPRGTADPYPMTIDLDYAIRSVR